MSITQSSDFVGIYGLSLPSYSLIDTHIAKYERHYLLRLLGSELYTAFVADLTGTPEEPQATRFEAIFEALSYDDGDVLVDSPGMLEMLKGFIWYHYVIDNNLLHTIGGMVSNLTENSTQEIGAKGAQFVLSKQSEATKVYIAIQKYIDDNIDDYPEYNGQTMTVKGAHW